jgi:hypothetical protein
VANHGVADYQPGPRINLYRPRLDTATIEQQGMAGDPESGDELIHDPTAHANEFILGPLATYG